MVELRNDRILDNMQSHAMQLRKSHITRATWLSKHNGSTSDLGLP